MRRLTLRSDALLRSLIKEYVITYQLPKSSSTASSTKETQSEMSGLFKVGLGTIAAVLGVGAIFGSEDESNDKNPLTSFATNISNAGDVLSSSGEAIDILVQESRRRRMLNESGETYNTTYGPVKSDLIDPIIVKNIQAAKQKTYFNLPDVVKFDNAANFSGSLQPAISEIKRKSTDLFNIVSKNRENKASGFPNDFAQFGLTLTDVDGLTDLSDNASVNEVIPANAALSDAVATAVFNQMKYQVVTFIGSLKGGIDKTVTEKAKKPPYEQALKRFIENVNRDMTPPSTDSRKILMVG
jgi:hypothetical protein